VINAQCDQISSGRYRDSIIRVTGAEGQWEKRDQVFRCKVTYARMAIPIRRRHVRRDRNKNANVSRRRTVRIPPRVSYVARSERLVPKKIVAFPSEIVTITIFFINYPFWEGRDGRDRVSLPRLPRRWEFPHCLLLCPFCALFVLSSDR
jgi:hypothetical protein